MFKCMYFGKSIDNINCRAKLGRGLLSGVYSKPPPEGADEKGLVSNIIMTIVEIIFRLIFVFDFLHQALISK